MGKILVVVYSWTGTARRVAQRLAGLEQWAVGEIRDAGAGRDTLRCVLDSLFRRRPAIAYDGPDPDAFDAVVLVSPIWAYRLAGPMRSFVAASGPRLRNVAVITVMGSRGAANAVSEIARLMGRDPVMDTSFTERDVEDGSFTARLEAYAKAVQQAVDRAGPVTRPVWSPQAV